MANCQPLYIVVSSHGKTIGRATFWRIGDEPLPLSVWIRVPAQAMMRRWPLLICRSPLSSSSGLILPEPPLRQPALETIMHVVQAEARRLSASAILFDYLETRHTAWPDWPASVTFATVSDPGTYLPIAWEHFEDYLAGRNKKERQHYKRSVREAERLGSVLVVNRTGDRLDEAETLIRNVERKFRSAFNPWARSMIAHLEQAHGIWLTASIDERMVGCGLLLQDHGHMLATCLGLDGDVPYIYFQLAYSSLRQAMAGGTTQLRFGSNAYDFKRRLGFSMEDNNHTGFQICNPLLQKATGWYWGGAK